MTRDEYYPEPNDWSDSERETYHVPSAFDTPYIWKIKRQRCKALINSIQITCDKTEEKHKYDSCVLKKPWFIGDFPFMLSVSQCEDYVTTLCQTKPNDVACTCLREELEINNPALPVVCFGPKCLDKGFVFRRMKEQDCNVNICQQLINVTGTNNMSITGKHHITCGHQVYTSQEIETIQDWQPAAAKTSIDPYLSIAPPKEGGLCNWHVIIIVISLFLLIMWLPILIVYFRKQHQIKLMNEP
jgi:hypothetical protein